jgi:hypothetical protein
VTPAVAERGLELPLPPEPAALRDQTRALVNRAPALGDALLEGGEWIAGFLWDRWGPVLERAGMQRAELARIAADYRRELWFWVVGERTWEHSAGGLRGRVLRRAGR